MEVVLESSLSLPSGPHHSPAPQEESKRQMREEDLTTMQLHVQ